MNADDEPHPPAPTPAAPGSGHRFFEVLLDTIPSPVFYKDTTGVYRGCNAAFAKLILGLPRDHIIGAKLADLPDVIPPDLARVYRQRDEDLLRNPGWQFYEAAVRCADGVRREFAFRKATFEDENGSVAGLVGVMLDITDLKEAERALRESERKYRHVTESIPVAVYSIGPDGRDKPRMVSRQIEDITGYPAEMFLSQPHLWDRLIHPEDREGTIEAVEAHRNEASPLDIEYRLNTRDGRVKWVRERARATLGEDGRPVRVDGFIEDVTEQKRTEEQLRQAQKMEAVGQLAGGVAHDFRNQLTVIRGFAESLVRHDHVDEAGREKVEQVLKASERSARLVDQLLAFSRRQVLQPQWAGLDSLIEDMETSLRRLIPEDITLDVRHGAGDCAVHLDAHQFQQALMNLTINARDAMPDGGTLRIETHCRPVGRAGEVGAWAKEDGPYAWLTVSDTGTGMDAQARAHAFEPFFTTKEVGKGTGLGLAMVYGFVRQSDGYVECESTPGEGTTVTLCFPCAHERPDEPHRDEPVSQEVPAGAETILVVEDEEAVRRVMVETLRQAGYTVLETGNAAEALPQGEHYEHRIHMLLTDVVMPGMSGRDLAERIRKVRPGILTVFVSGYADGELNRRGLQEGEVDLLRKPFSPAALLQHVRQRLDRERNA